MLGLNRQLLLPKLISTDTYHTQVVGDQTLSKAPQRLEAKLGTDFCLSKYRSAPSHLEV